ncbi:MAG: hypothetical protein JWP31_1483 [Aeromicrobium sp.]|nr:hypothetical protein [Aeromicrobium sp.]
MTDPDRTHPDGPEASPDADDVAAGGAQVEPGLVVEADEIDLDEMPDDIDSDENPEPELADDEVGEANGEGEPDVDDDAAAGRAGGASDPAPDREAQPEQPGAADRDQWVPTDDETGETVFVPSAGAGAATRSADEPPSDPPADDERKKRRWGRYVLLGLVGAAAALYVAGYFLTGTRMPANTTIGGVDVSGVSPSAARADVEKATTPRLDDALALTHGEGDGQKQFSIEPDAAGLALDLDRSIDRAGGQRSWDPRDMLALVAGHHDHDLALDVDDSKLQGFIGTISASVNQDVVEAQITFPKGKPVPREPKAGLVVSRSDTADRIRSSYLVSDEPIEVPTVTVEPAVDAEGLAEAVTTIGEPAVSGPVTLKVGDKRVSLPVTAYAPALVVRVEDGTLVPHLDAKKLAEPLTDSTTGIGKKAVDATVRITDGKPVVVPGKAGLGLQPKEMATKLIPVLTEKGDARTVEVEAKVVEPLFTTADAKALKITEKVGAFETQFPYAEYRNINQGRAAEIIDGTILKPGETFSFNNIVGERTEANGFVNGTVINGGVFREELGGGVSQVATTTYNAGFFGGMDDVEHHPHAFYIDRYPVGREATVYFGSLDLRFKNPTKYGVLVRAYVVPSTPSSPGEMHVELWSTKVWDRIEAGQSPRRNGRSPGKQYDDTDRCVPQSPIEGFDIDIYRTFYRDGRKVKTETDTANYQAADRVICGKKPD